jgi:hypothetical protein
MHIKFLEIVLQNPTRSYAEALDLLRFAYPPATPPPDSSDSLLDAVARIEQAHHRRQP